MDDNVDVSAARGVLEIGALVAGGVGAQDGSKVSFDVIKVVCCVEEAGGGGGGGGRGEGEERAGVDEGGTGVLLGRFALVVDDCAGVCVDVAVLCCPVLVLVHFFSSSSSSHSSSFSSGSFSFSLSCLAWRSSPVFVALCLLLRNDCFVSMSRRPLAVIQ